jgi:nucleotide-binding universal stress UspA family protein
MTRISRVLVPVDFSKASQKAMYYATHLALKFNAGLTAAHIIPSFSAFNYAFPENTTEFEKKALEEAKVRLPEEVPAEYREQLNPETIVKIGDVRDELLATITEKNVDLVVMGTHGRRTVGRFFLGSAAENILRRCPVPILTVSHRTAQQQAESPFDVPFRRILYATDLSEGGLSGGLHYAVDLARTLAAHLTLIHVIQLRETAAFEDTSAIRAHHMAELHKAIHREHGEDLVVATEVLQGTPYHEILKYAETMSADLIVINLHSKGFFERALLGATAERVIRSASIPVLSIPVDAAAELAPEKVA